MIVPEAHLSALQDTLATLHTGAERSRLLVETAAAADQVRQAIEFRTRQVVRDASQPTSDRPPVATVAHCVRALGVSARKGRELVEDAPPPGASPTVKPSGAVSHIINAPVMYGLFDGRLAKTADVDAKLRLLADFRAASQRLCDGIDEKIDEAARARLREGLRAEVLMRELGLSRYRLRHIRIGLEK